MKTILCHRCHTTVAQIKPGSLIKRDAIMLCAECAKEVGVVKDDPVVEGLRKMFGMK